MVPLELADTLDVEPAERLVFSCDVAELDGEENLAMRALRALEAACGREIHARVRLSKEIPTKAGLGGGSSDAAAVLAAAMEGRFGELPELDWLALARELGSDVPFFLTRTAALVEGTGERVTALGSVPSWAVLVVKPPASVSTAQAYASLDARKRTTRTRSDSISLQCAQALQRRDLDVVQGLLSNDFQEMVLEEPQIRRAFDALRAAGAQRPLLAGSGSCVFAIFADASVRDAVAARLDLSPDFIVLPTAFANDRAWRTEGMQ